jgi:hypothetical protein
VIVARDFIDVILVGCVETKECLVRLRAEMYNLDVRCDEPKYRDILMTVPSFPTGEIAARTPACDDIDPARQSFVTIRKFPLSVPDVPVFPPALSFLQTQESLYDRL